jgi:hypothetical protein
VANLFPVTRASASRRVLRIGAVALATASVLQGPPALAGTPGSWPDPPVTSTMQALLILVGGPLAIIFVVSLLVLAPSLVRGDRQQRGVSSWTEPQWFGGPGDAVPAGRRSGRAEIGTGDEAVEPGAAAEAERPGGASARW